MLANPSGEFAMSACPSAADRCPSAPLAVLGSDVTVPLVTGGEVTYAALDYAASAPALQRVWDDVAAYAPYYGSVHRGAGYLSQLSTDLFETSRKDVAAFLGCREDDQVVFTRSTTDSLNLLAAALPAGTRGVRLRDRAPRLAAAVGAAGGRPGDLPRRAALAAAGRRDAGEGAGGPGPSGPALVCVTGASNVTGELWPVRELAAAAHAHGARIVLDAAQLAPHHPVDIADVGRGLGGLLRAQAVRALRRGRAGGPRRLAARGRAVPRGRRRRAARSRGATDGGVDVEWHTTRGPARGRFART